MKRIDRRLLAVVAFPLAALWALPTAHALPLFQQTNLVSDIPGLATFTDPNLKNPWGIASGGITPFWVSNQVTGTSTLYSSTGQPQGLVVTIPGGHPTGQVFNTTADFKLPVGGQPSRFIFSTLEGTIAAWNQAQGSTAQIMRAVDGAVYTGLAVANNGTASFLYAANTAQNTIDVFDGNFTPTTLAGAFSDPTLPAGFSVYNVQQIGGVLVTTYENDATGGGFVDAFDLNGTFLRRITGNGPGGPLDAPWGLAIAPSTFGSLAGALLVGNEEDGRISAFDFTTGAFLGQLLDLNGDPLSNTGLWGLRVGNGGNGGDPGTLYFAAGINGERNGLFGAITLAAVPEPGSLALTCLAITVLLRVRRGTARHGD